MAASALLLAFRNALESTAPERAGELTELSLETPIDDAGLDSIELLELITELEDRMGCVISDEDLDGLETIGDLAALIERRVGPPSVGASPQARSNRK